MHEVGHTLGLRHNFRASRVYTEAQLADPAFTRANGITGSVMEYAPINLTRPGEPRAPTARRSDDTLGPYDYWAIEYAYKPCSGLAGRREAPRCEQIAGAQRRAAARLRHRRGQLPRHRPRVAAVRPRQRRRSAFAKKRIAIAQDLLQAPGNARARGPTRTTTCCGARSATRSRDVARAADVLARQIGGVRTLRDCAGHRPRSAAAGAGRRRSARRSTSSPAACSRPTACASRRRCSASSAPTSSERSDAMLGGEGSARPTIRRPQQVLGLQRALLGRADERHGRHPRCSKAARRRRSAPAAPCACPSCTAA